MPPKPSKSQDGYADERITALHRAFGSRSFTTYEASVALGIDLAAAIPLLLYGSLVDCRFRVGSDSDKWKMNRVGPEVSAAASLWSAHKRQFHDGPLSNVPFARRTGLPLPSANWILSLLVKHGHLKPTMIGNQSHRDGSGAAVSYMPIKSRKVIMQAEPEPRRRRVVRLATADDVHR